MIYAASQFSIGRRAVAYFEASARQNTSTVDRMMAWLLALEWAGIMVVASANSAFVWEGADRHWNPHLLAAVFAGPVFIFPAIATALLYPSRALTRHVVAVAQMLVSVVLIGLTNGRIETHFHVFGSLAFLAFYRDWRVLITASAVAAIDHVARGIWWPASIYGALTVNPFRWLEHVWWVVFEDFFLLLAIQKGVAESKELAHSKSLLYEGAYHDVLTGLGNRRLLSEQFHAALTTTPDVRRALLFVDLDRFKQANDLHGHLVGDKLLQEVAKRLASTVDENAVLARIGGDEFNVFLREASEKDAAALGKRLLDSLTEPFNIEGHNLLLSATVGIGLCPQHGATLEGLQECADQAMYAAKAHGRNQVAIYSESHSANKSDFEGLARDLFDAQANDQFHLCYQPLIGRNGKVSGFEALLRWKHPSLGLIMPAQFLPIAERSALILPIGEWVMEEACRQCRIWQSGSGAPVGVSINISAVQFEQPSFPEQVGRIAAQAGLHPSLLTLDINEGVAIRDMPKAHSHLNSLRSQGIRVSLDDFGTGFSSLSYLAELPVDSIKLDRSFIQREVGKGASVVEAVVELAHRIGLKVVAEGVESQMEADWLMTLNCDELQGYYVSWPLPGSLVLPYLISGPPVANAA